MHDHGHDHHAHRSLNVPDAPFDAANQSLSDALRASFNVLKAIMIVVVVLFLFSGLECVQEHQQAVVLRFGRLLGGAQQVRESGLSWALPYPVDETLLVGVTAERLNFDSHWLMLQDNEKTLPLSQVRRPGQGLKPGRDGALLTGDKGLAHVKWSLVYRIVDLPAFVRTVSDANDDSTRRLIQVLLENSAVRAAAELTAAEITQTRTDSFAREVKRRLNLALEALGTGIDVTTLEIPVASVPVQTLGAFLKVTQAENEKDAKIQKAKQDRSRILYETAGAAHRELIPLLDELEIARAEGRLERVDALRAQIDGLIEHDAGGMVKRMIRQVRGQYTEVTQGLEGDVEQYEKNIDEYLAAPRLLVNRLWEETRRRLLAGPGVKKTYVPSGRKELRLLIHPDPEARREEERDRYAREAGVGPADGRMDFRIVPDRPEPKD